MQVPQLVHTCPAAHSHPHHISPSPAVPTKPFHPLSCPHSSLSLVVHPLTYPPCNPQHRLISHSKQHCAPPFRPQVKVTTVDGPVELKIPPGTQPGTTLLMAKRGVPRLGNASMRGDHQVRTHAGTWDEGELSARLCV